MRAGGVNCAAQHTLSPEAASVLKHSLTLSRRRGHAQVTPLHVAATLLSSRTSLLRRACLKSQPPNLISHPLQCRALELCFNVALNRLPATPGPFLHSTQTSLSNALVAALKRAQAHQRRGCIEQQQQQHQQPPLLAVKVELEQLILSILDDPSVSRVMREAGFNSIAVKENLEDCANSASSIFQCYNANTATGGIYSTPSSPPNYHHQNPNSSTTTTTTLWQNPFLFSPNKKTLNPNNNISSFKEDIKVVFDVMTKNNNNNKRRNTVIIGDTLAMAEGVVSDIMAKVGTGDVPDELKSSHFIKFQFSSVPLKFMKREEVEMNVSDLKRKVDTFVLSGGRVIIYTGDLKWTVVDDDEGDNETGVYSPVAHLVAEMGKLMSWYNYDSSTNNCSRVWLMGTASYETYMKCKMMKPPLDVQWSLQSVSVPSSVGLGLSLLTSCQESRVTNFLQSPCHDKSPFCVKEEEEKEQDVVLTCCPECKSNYDKESGSPQLPNWLKPHAAGIQTSHTKEELVQLRRKYNKMCQTIHQGSHNPNHSSSINSNQWRNYNYPSSYPRSWPNKNSLLTDSETISFANYPASKSNQSPVALPRFRRQQSCHIEFSFSNGASKYNQSVEPNLDSLKGIDDKDVKITLALGNSTFSDGITSETAALNALCDENMPWQSETIPLIIEALMDPKEKNQDKFLLIRGNDLVGKRRLAVGIAKSLFGSSDLLFCMNMIKNTNTVSENREMVEKALSDHQKVVVLIEGVDYADPEFVKFLVDGFEDGKLRDFGEEAIFVLTMDDDMSYNKAKGNKDYVIEMKVVVGESTLGLGLPKPDDHKRKADWDLPIIRNKSQKIFEMEEVSSGQPSLSVLDLNIKADEDESKEVKPGEVSPISSDLTRETTIEQRSSLKCLEKIKNCFVLNMNSGQEQRAREMFSSKFKKCYDDITSNGSVKLNSFDVEETLLDEVLQGSGLYLNDVFDKWVTEVFETGLGGIGIRGGGYNVSVRLCLGGKGGGVSEDGFMGTCLPKRIQVSLIG